MKLDRIDIKILSALQGNGRIANVELADLVGLSPSACLIRVKRLQVEGYIKGYLAQIDVAKIGQAVTVFTEITLRNHRPPDFARFVAAIERIAAVMECHLISGGYDYLLKIVAPDIVGYQSIMERMNEMDIGIDKYFSFIVLKSPIVRSNVPLDHLVAS